MPKVNKSENTRAQHLCSGKLPFTHQNFSLFYRLLSTQTANLFFIFLIKIFFHKPEDLLREHGTRLISSRQRPGFLLLCTASAANPAGRAWDVLSTLGRLPE